MRLPEFRPPSVPVRDIMEVLLNILYNCHICCHFSGCFVTYIAQIFNKHSSICLYIAKNDTPLQNILFQGGSRKKFIDLEGFQLQLLKPDFVWDMVKYNFTYGEFFSVQLNIFGIDYVLCRPESNVEFVHFVWDNVEQFSCTRPSITLLPLTTILALFQRCSTSFITGVRATGGVIRTVAQCSGPST